MKSVMVESTLPPQTTPLIGRDKELAAVTERLKDTDCRLLTVVGPGGVGKTRLAIEAASQVERNYDNGVVFVDLQPASSTDFTIALASALPLTLSGAEEPGAQLIRYLQDKQALLLLDNFEHLLEEAHFLNNLISRTPDIKLIVTSREALNLQDEWLFPLRGLSVPEDFETENPGDYGAVQLFREHARRLNPDFSLEKEGETVVRICRLVEGLPLALKLAASWTTTLSCADIADEIEENLDFLSTTLRDIPRRHRSMRAVFTHSWDLLNKEERAAFQGLSVFQGGFRREAAAAVANASLPVLSKLLDTSLLRRTKDNRYVIHELLRQYAGEKLARSSPKSASRIRDRHTEYYLAFLADRTTDISGARQIEASAEIAAEFDNVRTAWQRAVSEKKVTMITEAAFTLYNFCQFGSRYLEGAQMFKQAAASMDDAVLATHPRAMVVLTCLGWFLIRLGRFGEAQETFSRADTIYQQLADLPEMPYAFAPRLGLALLDSMHGENERAKRILRKVLEKYEENENHMNQAMAQYVLAGIHLSQGQYNKADQNARAAYTASSALGDRWFMAYCLNSLGDAAAAQRDHAAATRHYQASYTIRKAFDDAEGMAVALNHMGEAALAREDTDKARNLFQESLEIYQGIHDKGGLAAALHGLGQTALARGDLDTAMETLQRALHIAAEIQFKPLILDIIVSASKTLLQNGRKDGPADWLTYVQAHPTADHRVKSRAYQLQEKYGVGAVDPGDKFRPMTAVTTAVQAKLSLLTQEQLPGREEEHRTASSLVEPLTRREREVLALLGRGLTNQEIAEELTVAVGTVKAHNHNIYGKLGADNRVEAVTRARELELI